MALQIGSGISIGSGIAVINSTLPVVSQGLNLNYDLSVGNIATSFAANILPDSSVSNISANIQPGTSISYTSANASASTPGFLHFPNAASSGNFAETSQAPSDVHYHGSMGIWFRIPSTFTGTNKLAGLENNNNFSTPASNYDKTTFLTGGGNISSGFYSGGPQLVTISNNNYNDNKWHYAVATWQAGANYTLYVDGVTQSSISYSVAQVSAFTPAYWRVGGYRLAGWGQADTNFTGDIAMFQTYNRALTQYEVYQNFTASRNIFGV